MEILVGSRAKALLVMGVVTIAVVGFGLVFSARLSIDRHRAAMDSSMRFTGRAVIAAVESSLRRSMHDSMHGGLYRPEAMGFFRELEQGEDVLFVGLVNEKGASLITSGAVKKDIEAAGDRLPLSKNALEALVRDGRWWGRVNVGERQIFIYSKEYREGRMMRGRGRMGHGSGDLQQPPASGPMSFLVVGLDVSREMSGFGAFRRTVILQSGFILAVLAVIWGLGVALIRRRETAGRVAMLERFNSRLLDNLPDGLLSISHGGRILAANPAASSIIGAVGGPAGALVGMSLNDLDNEVAAVLGPEKADAGERKSPERRTPTVGLSLNDDGFEPGGAAPSRASATLAGGWRMHRLGDAHLESLSVSVAGDSENEGIRLVLVRDRTHLRTLEKELAEAEKLATVGTLAAGVAHEIRNPLSALRGFAQFFARKFADRNPESEYARTMVTEADRLNRVITDLLYYARPKTGALMPVDLRGVVSGLESLMRFDLERHGVEFETDLQVPEIHADPDAVRQVLLNLAINAVDAISGTDADEAGRIVVASEERDGMIAVSVRDNGPGMTEEQRRRALDPFFTGKASGTGLGLAIVSTVMKNHGGRVVLGDAEEGGEAVTLLFPMPDGSTGDGIGKDADNTTGYGNSEGEK